MQWLNKIVEEVIAQHPDGEILIESGGSPSGTYHLGHLRELITADAILQELKRRGRRARHIYYSDDLDALRKIPVNVPADYEKYLGKSLCDIPSPDDPKTSYANYFLQDLVDAAAVLQMEIEFIHTHQKYRAGFFSPAIELALEHAADIRKVLENVSGHKLGEEWSPIQINEDGYLKKRRFLNIDKQAKTVSYEDKEKRQQSISYHRGEVKLDWRIDWPARWWLLRVNVEPFGRDHASAGGSYDTGAALMKEVFKAPAPLPVPYDFVNLVGDTKKMSASKGTGLDAITTVKILPPEIVRFLMLKHPPSKRLYFDPVNGVSQLIDEFAQLLAKEAKTKEDNQLIEICTHNLPSVVSTVPFSHLVASYQSALKDVDKTIDIIKRTEHGHDIENQREIIEKELAFINQWLEKWAPEDVKFKLLKHVEPGKFTPEETKYLQALGQKIAQAPTDADGEWFHKAIYEFKESMDLTPQQVFKPLYRSLIGKDSGPRAGWFLSTLPREWLIKRLKLEG